MGPVQWFILFEKNVLIAAIFTQKIDLESILSVYYAVERLIQIRM